MKKILLIGCIAAGLHSTGWTVDTRRQQISSIPSPATSAPSIPAQTPRAPSTSGQPAATPAAAAPADERYTVGVEDVLEVVVLRPEKMEQVVTVGPDGSISLPYVGSVPVKGKRLNQIRDNVQRLLASGYMKYPEVAVSLKESRSRKFFISGEVLKPGSYPMDDSMTAIKAVSLAGGFAKSGTFGRGKILRPEAGGQTRTIPFDFSPSGTGKNNGANIRVQSGDTIVVLEDKFFVYGAVAKPGTYPIENNTSVMKAISLVGGFSKNGPSSHVKVLRPKANRGDYETIVVNVKGILDGSDERTNILIEPDDTIVVTEDKFNVYGAIAKPGTYDIEENTTVLKAIAMVGGFTKFGSSSRVKILRPRLDGKGYESIKVNIKGIMNGNDPEADVLLKAGDTVVVSEGIF